MKLFETKTKKNLVYLILATSMFFVAFEVGILSKYYPENVYGSSFLFGVFVIIGIIFCIILYQKAKKEDKLLEGL